VDTRPESTDTVRLVVLVGIATLAAWAISRLLWPLLPAIVTSASLAVVLRPAYQWLARHVRRPSLAAFIGTTTVFFLVLLPVTGLSFVLVGQLREGLDWLAGHTATLFGPGGILPGFARDVAARLGIDEAAAQERLQTQLVAAGTALAGRAFGFLTGLGGMVVQGAIALFTLYYLLRDTDGLVRALKRLVPLDDPRTDRLFSRAQEVILATIYGNVVVAMAQGTLGGIAFAILGIQTAALWGTVMAFLSLLPLVGSAFVWVPAGVLLFTAGHVFKAIALLLFGTLVISTIDNVLRAWLVSGRAQLHPLVTFFSVLGGILVLGGAGIFAGPVLFVLGLTVIDMARLSLQGGEEHPGVLTGTFRLR
jgi:predicted PurR-regulated permease PerM